MKPELYVFNTPSAFGETVADRVSFIVSGVEKSGIVAKVLNRHGDDLLLPASRVSLVDGLLEWYVDIPAASLIRD